MADYKIGTTLAGMVNIETLGLPVPRSTFQTGERVTLADGKMRELGWGKAEWVFPVLTTSQRSALRTYCTGVSANVYIRTLTADNTYSNYLAAMIWPEDEEQRAGFVFDLRVRFNLLEAA